MAINDKIYVTKVPGAGATGQINAVAGMTTNLGTVNSIANGISSVGTGAPTQGKFYDYNDKLFITETNASTGFAYPSGDGTVLFGHHTGAFASGVPTANTAKMTVSQGGVPYTFNL